MAAQAGVRYSLENPAAYIRGNLVGFGHVILEGCRHHGVGDLVYASSSSVYGGNRNLPFERQPVNHPVSLYAASKKANERWQLQPSLWLAGTGRFSRFMALGRPDMAPMLFARAILVEPIKVFNHGKMQRDFTYTTSLRCFVVATSRLLPILSLIRCSRIPKTAAAQHRVFNIGNSQPTELLRFIAVVEEAFLGSNKVFTMQPGDVVATNADTQALYEWVGFKPSTPIELGIEHFLDGIETFTKFRQ